MKQIILVLCLGLLLGMAWGQATEETVTYPSVTVEEKAETLVLSTFHQESISDSIHAANLPRNIVRLPLHDQIWGISLGGLPVDTVGTYMTIKSITLVDLGEDITERVESLTILNADGDVLGTSGAGERSNTAHLELGSERATHVMAYTTVYTFDEPITVPCHGENGAHDRLYSLEFNPVEGYTGGINIPVFTNKATLRTDADATRLHITDDMTTAPYMEITGTATFKKYSADFTATGTYQLSTLLANAKDGNGTAVPFQDTIDDIVLVRVSQPDVIIHVDQAIANAELIVASETPASVYENGELKTRAATLRKTANDDASTAFKGNLSVRDIAGSTVEGFVRFEYLDADGNLEETIPASVFSPASFTQKCSVELASYPQKGQGDWFGRNPFRIAPEHDLRLVTCVGHTEENLALLPDVEFSDPTANLDLAFAGTDDAQHTMAGALGALIDKSSGTISLHSPTVTTYAAIPMGSATGNVYGMPTEQFLHVYHTLNVKSLVIAAEAGTMADVVQHTGTTTIDGALTFGDGGAARAFYTLKDGTTTVTGLTLLSEDTSRIYVTVGDNDGAANSAKMQLQGGFAPFTAGAQESAVTGLATVDVLADGRLEIPADASFLPMNRTVLNLKGGTLVSTGASTADTTKATWTFGTDATLGGGLRVDGGGTIVVNGTHEMVLDMVTGKGDLTIDGKVTIQNLTNYTGTLRVVDPATDSLVIERMEGINSRVIFGELGTSGTTGVANILTMAEACGYRGSIGFEPKNEENNAYRVINVEQVPIETFNHAFYVHNGQELIIRLDQFADAILAWPEEIVEDNPPILTLVEAGAYGGRLTMPHIPAGVTVNFQYYDEDGARTNHNANTWKITTEESGATDILSWEEPHVSGKSVWVDIEFNGDSYNTGWMTLGPEDGSKNGVLRGTSSDDANEGGIMTAAADFITTNNPLTTGAILSARPYVAPSDLEYPKEWSAVVRMTAPTTPNKCILTLGTTYMGHTSAQGGEALVLATGPALTDEQKEIYGDKAQELILWRVMSNTVTNGVDTNGDGTDDAFENGDYSGCMEQIATAIVANATTIQHVISAVFKDDEITVYLDGRQLIQKKLQNWTRIGDGLQVGQMLDGNWNPRPIWNLLLPAESGDGGTIDYMRFYKGGLTPEAMTALSEESPAIDRATRYLRTLTNTTNEDNTVNNTFDWVDESKPWIRQTWSDNGTSGSWTTHSEQYAEPTEGAEVRIICTGDHILNVNVQRDPESGFLSRDRMYSLFCVTPSETATANTSLTLVPIGGDITTQEKAKESTWMNEPKSETTLKDKDYTYGRLIFQGGANDFVHPELAMADYSTKHHTFWLRANTTVSDDSDVTEGTENKVAGTSLPNGTKDERWSIRSTYTQTKTVTETRTDTRITEKGKAVACLTATAGILGMQAQTPIFLGATGSKQERTLERTVTYTRTTTEEFSSWNPPDHSEESTDYGAWSAPTYSAWDPDPTNASEAETGWTTVLADAAVLTEFTLQADYSLVRGKSTQEAFVEILTGPVEGAGTLKGNTGIVTSQVSENVWVPKFTDGDEWHISDVTETYYNTTTNTNSNPGGTISGLIAKVMQVPGRLYLDLGTQAIEANGDFSKQKWYRYGYMGTDAEDTDSGEAPTVASVTDFNMAIAFQIRTKAGNDQALVLDTTKTDVATLRIDLPDGYKSGDTIPSLTLNNPNSNSMTLTSQLITFARLVDLQGALSIPQGTLIHGHTTGTYAFKNHSPSHLIKDSTVANMEVHGDANVFGGSVELHDTNLILADDAKLTQSNPEGHLWMKSLTMGDGATLEFLACGEDTDDHAVVFRERVTLEGATATLCGAGAIGSATTGIATNTTPTTGFFTAEGFTAETNNAKLILDTYVDKDSTTDDATRRWICNTADFQTTKDVTGFGLEKKGIGIVAFRDMEPPSLSGPVTVTAGTLKVGGKAATSDALIHDNHLSNAIGHHGLHVADGATLTHNYFTPRDYVIACLPTNQSLSGTGTIDGDVRLCSGAIVDGTGGKGIGITIRRFVVDTSAASDVEVKLPDDVADGNVLFYLLEDSVRSESRRRFKAMQGTTRWDVLGDHTPSAEGVTPAYKARYILRTAQLPVPENPTDSSNNAYTGNVDKTYILYYQAYGVSHIAHTIGRTLGERKDDKGNLDPYMLNASEISNAFRCFSNVWTFSPTPEPKDVDQNNLLMAYEFGISRMDMRSIEGVEYVIIEVAIENALSAHFGETYSTLPGADVSADFQLNTTVELVQIAADGKATPCTMKEIRSYDATDLTEPSVTTRTVGRRYYAIPVDELALGVTHLRANAIVK